MDSDPDGEQPGRFGFDVAELELHAAEAHLALDDAGQAAAHAVASLQHTTVGRPGWAAAVLALAASEVRRGHPGDGAELAITVLDIIPADLLRETARQRLARLERNLGPFDQRGRAARDLRERLRALPPLVGAPRLSDESARHRAQV
jgi:hypothetical protein